MANIITAFRAACKAGLEISVKECPETTWTKWIKANERLCTIARGELMTFVEVAGLNYLSQAIQAFQSSPEFKEMRDCTMSNYKIYFAYANDFKH